MKTLFTLLLAIGMMSTSFAQDTLTAHQMTKKEIKKLKREKEKKERMGMYNEYKINVNAPTLADAIRYYLGSATLLNGNVTLRSNNSMGNAGSPFALWDVDGNVTRSAPMDVDFNSIREVLILRSLAETNKYGMLGSSGVIVIKTTRTEN